MPPTLILLVGMATILGAILLLRLNAFLALIIAAIVVSLLAPGEPAVKIARVAEGFGRTAGTIGVVIALASIAGKAMMDSGAADRIVKAFLALLGEKRGATALCATGYVLSIPLFFDTVFYLIVPLARSMYARTNRNYLKYIMAIAAGAAATHTLVPPTPGPLAVAGMLGVDLGTMVLVGMVVAVPAAGVGLLYAGWVDRRMPVLTPCPPSPFGRGGTPDGLRSAVVLLVHAAFGGSTDLLLHIPAIAHAAGLRPPTVEDWIRVNRATPRLVDALPNGPRGHPTVQVFMAGGVPEVMLHLREMGLLHGDVLTATGDTLDATLDWWATSDRRRAARARLRAAAAGAPDDGIMGPDAARRAGLTSTVVFPVGNLAPEGAVIKATALDPSVVGDDQVYRHLGAARVFVDERDAIRAVKGATERPIRPGDVIVLIGTGPSGTGMPETAQITTALRYLPWGKHVALLTDGRFSGFSSGACVGHIGPEALDGGPIGRVRDDDLIEIVIDRGTLTGSVNLVGAAGQPLDAAACPALRAQRQAHPGLAPHPALPADTRLRAALQRASGGTWARCVYDVDRIVAALEAGLNLTKEVK